MLILALALISVFLALNMGVSGFSVSFTPSYGSKVLKLSQAALLYGVCVLAGGVLIGPRVVNTLVHKILAQAIDPASGFVILLAAAIMMFVSNILKIPQSTSFVTVSSFLGAGLFYGKVNWHTIVMIVLVASVFSLLSFFLTFFIKRKIYPPRQKNFRLYEKFHIHRNKFRKFIIFHDMYAAFGIGTNNVANVVAPVISSLAINPILALVIAAPLFGLGAYFSGEKVIKTVSKEIVPIGEISAVIVSFITATFVIIASSLGLPTPYVQFTTFSILAISCIKDGTRHTLGKSIFKRLIFVWALVPLVTVGLSYILHLLFIKG